MDRQSVFALINQERAYQDERWGVDHDRGNTIDDWADYIERYLKLIKYTNDRPFGIYDVHTYRMEQFRKIAALTVAAMEQNETPKREM